MVESNQITIGCAGGQNVRGSFVPNFERPTSELSYRLKIYGLYGGIKLEIKNRS
jgi:hypothetical protein